MFMLNDKLSVGASLSSEDESVWEVEASEEETTPEETDPRRDPVYECCDTALWRKRLVLTPYMLLDRLHVCAELAKEVQEGTPSSDMVANHVDRLSDEVNHLLRLLERSGLWIDSALVNQPSCDGHVYSVLKEPFTAGA